MRPLGIRGQLKNSQIFLHQLKGPVSWLWVYLLISISDNYLTKGNFVLLGGIPQEALGHWLQLRLLSKDEKGPEGKYGGWVNLRLPFNHEDK